MRTIPSLPGLSRARLALALGVTLVACGSSTASDAGADVVASDIVSSDIVSSDVVSNDVVASDVVVSDVVVSDVVVSDASRDVAIDAVADRVEPACDFSAAYTFGPDGGLVAVRALARVEPGRRFTYTRTGVGLGDAGMLSCATLLDACGAGNSTLAAITALQDPDVVAAFADQTNTLYGSDPRPVDGQVFQVTRGDGRHIEVGNDCSGAGCRAIPAGLTRLREALTALQSQQLARAECASVRP